MLSFYLESYQIFGKAALIVFQTFVTSLVIICLNCFTSLYGLVESLLELLYKFTKAYRIFTWMVLSEVNLIHNERPDDVMIGGNLSPQYFPIKTEKKY